MGRNSYIARQQGKLRGNVDSLEVARNEYQLQRNEPRARATSIAPICNPGVMTGLGNAGNDDVSGVMAMLRASTISDPRTSTSHDSHHPDSDHQFCIGFVMSPRMFAESFRVKKWAPKTFATVSEDGDIKSDDLRLYHYRQFMTKHPSRRHLPVKLRDSVQLDCQHRPVLVRFAEVRIEYITHLKECKGTTTTTTDRIY